MHRSHISSSPKPGVTCGYYAVEVPSQTARKCKWPFMCGCGPVYKYEDNENFTTLKQDMVTHLLLLTLLPSQNFGHTQRLHAQKAGTIT